MMRRPILVGGIGLSLSLWMLQSLNSSLVDLGELGILSLIVICVGLWLFQQNKTKKAQIQISTPLDRATVEKAIAQTQDTVNQLVAEAENPANAQLTAKVAALKAELDRHQIRLAVTGGKAVGKSTLIKVLDTKIAPQQNISLVETAPLFTSTDANLVAQSAALKTAIASDLVLFLTNGDLTDSEWQILQQIMAANQNLILVFNKQDQYLPDERAMILLALQKRMPEVVGCAASPNPLKVRQHQADGAIQEWLEQPEPDIQQLAQHLNEILTPGGEQLVWSTIMRTAGELKAEAKNLLNQVRRDRALPIIEQYQWIAAAAAFANPVPALDILATAAITAQLVIDLGGIYQQKFSLQQAQTVAGTMASLMLKLGLVELSTKAIATVLKSNAITFIAGGAVQGVSAAYLTRLAGVSLIEYFQQQEVATSETGLHLDKLGQTLQKVFQHQQQINFMPTFVKQGLERLLPASVVSPES